MSLSYRDYKNSYLVTCENMNKYEDFFIPLGAKWVRDSEISGFLIPKEKEVQLKKIINFINIKENAKSRKMQHKYHRAVSDSEDTDEDTDEDADEDKKVNRKKYKKSDPKTYYKSFDSKPVNFKNINRNEDDESENEYSSSSTYEDSSSDNYPSPGTPERKNIKVDDLIKTINNLENRIEYLEKKNRK